MAIKSLLILTKERNAALASLSAAKTDAKRKGAIEALTALSGDAFAALGAAKSENDRVSLHGFIDTLSKDISSRTVRKMRHVEEEVTDDPPMAEEEGDEDEDEEPEDGEEPDGDEDEEPEDGEEPDGDEDDEPEDEDETPPRKRKAEADDEPMGESKKALLANGGRRAVELFDALRSVTGQRSVAGVLGAVSALKPALDARSNESSRLAKLEQENRRVKVDSALKAARMAGKITKAESQSLAAVGMKDFKWLKGHLAMLPEKVRSERTQVVGSFESAQPPSAARQRAMMNGGRDLSPDDRIRVAAMSGASKAEIAVWDEISESIERRNAEREAANRGGKGSF